MHTEFRRKHRSFDQETEVLSFQQIKDRQHSQNSCWLALAGAIRAIYELKSSALEIILICQERYSQNPKSIQV